MMIPRRIVAVALAAVVLAPQPVQAAQPVRAATGWSLPPLTVQDAQIKDVRGRTVILRGVNVNQLNDYAQNDQPLPTTAPLGETDFAEIAGLGFNVVRLNLAWSALEPTPGAFSQAYVARIRAAVADAKKYGIYTVLDMHQDAWGKAVGTPAGTSCPPLTNPGIGWDGAPAWATRTDGWSTCNAAGVREVSPAVARAFQNFYDDRDGIQGHLVRTWARLAAEFKNEPAVAGYDLLNEPNPGLRTPGSAAEQLGRFYQRTIDAIRATGSQHLVIFEPSVLWSAFGIDAVPPGKYLTDPLAVFSPHLYSESINLFGSVPSIGTAFAIARLAAASYGVPLWSGEWGWFGDPAEQTPKVDRFLDNADNALMGGAWWSWKQACGDPHPVRDGSTHRPQGNLSQIDCPSGTPLGLSAFRTPLSRPYPRAAPGLKKITSRPYGFTGDRRSGDCTLEAWFPGTAKPSTTTRGLTDLTYTQAPGGWQLTACATGPYELRTS
ncbi:MAG: cellulase family glycosylhydrolase [Streptosporangiaceae bacterium]